MVHRSHEIVVAGVVVVVLVLITAGCADLFGSGSSGGGGGSGGDGVSDMTDARVTQLDIELGWNIVDDKAGNLWTSNANGLWRYNRNQQSGTQFHAADYDALRSDNAGAMVVDGTDVWVTYGWAGDEEYGIGVTKWSSPPDGTFEHYKYDDPEEFPQGPVWAVAKDGEGNIWIGSRFEVGTAHFDGNSWTHFAIEGQTDRYFDCSTIVFDDSDRGYFGTWRGGLHVYDFDQGKWLHTDKGNDSGTESFLDRGFFEQDLAIANDDAELYVATRNWDNDFVEDADGVWKYDYNSSEWTNLTLDVPGDVGETRGTVFDAGGNMYTYFHHDRKLRRYDGTSWSVVELEGYTPSASDYLVPYYHDSETNSIWLRRAIEDANDRTVVFDYE